MWELTSTHNAAITTVPDSQVGIAFNRLMANPRTYLEYRFAFFMDGLDEFEGD